MINLTERGLDDPRAAWSPDGQQLAYIAGLDTGLYLWMSATGEVRRLADQGDYGGVTWATK